MTLVYKIRTLLSMDRRTMRIHMEAYLYLIIARLWMLLPFRSVAATLGKHMQETDTLPIVQHHREIRTVGSAIRLMSRYTLFHSSCLIRAIAGQRMLKRRGIPCTLYFGTGRDEEGKLGAHAWLRTGSYLVTGGEEKSRFTVVSSFASSGKPMKNEGEAYGRQSEA